MNRTGRVFLIFLIIVGCMAGLWFFQAWRESEERASSRSIRNAYITSISGTSVTAVAEGEKREWESAGAVSGQSISGIADIYLQDEKIVRIVKKPESIKGKVLKISDKVISLEEYGDVKLDKNFVVYRREKGGEIKQGSLSDIVVGYSGTRFVAAGKRICAAVIEDSRLESIRVILKDNDSSSYDMGKTTLTATSDFYVKIGSQTKQYKKGQRVVFQPASMSGRARVSTGGKGKIRIESLKRQYGVPEYRGNIEIEKSGTYLHIINELPLEEYLYSVVPSEMPTEYAKEALKAQAICARSYAVEHMKGNRLAKYGAHVDDSVSFQVYNNLKEDEKSIAAVRETRNQVITHNGKVAATYFFSVSCGSTATPKDVWFAERNEPYLISSTQTLAREKRNLKDEKTFIQYIKEAPETIDSSSTWYRWKAKIRGESLKKSVDLHMRERYEVNPTQIQVRQKDGTYKSRKVSDIGDIQNIYVRQRGEGGVVTFVEIEGTKETVRVYTEYNIRTLLIGEDTVFERKDKKKVTGLSLLPSGFFYVEKKGDSFVFYGGGYGHGVGMSQQGANTLAGQGKNCLDILTFYFPNTNVQSRESL